MTPARAFHAHAASLCAESSSRFFLHWRAQIGGQSGRIALALYYFIPEMFNQFIERITNSLTVLSSFSIALEVFIRAFWFVSSPSQMSFHWGRSDRKFKFARQPSQI